MFSIETSEDVKILKELTSSSNDIRIRELENQVNELSEVNKRLLVVTEQQRETIENITDSLITADQCKEIVFNVLNNGTKKENIIKRGRAKKIPLTTDDFEFTKAMKKKFNKIIVNGNDLIHQTVKNQRMDIPISTIQLLALVEVYQHRQRKLLVKDSQNFCKLYNINKVQFGKVYYNLKEGVFFRTLNEIDDQIKRTVFKMKDGKIHLVKGSTLIDTGIDSKLFNQLLNIYINSNQPYATVYKLSLEHSDINPIHLLIVLKRNSAVSKVILEAK